MQYRWSRALRRIGRSLSTAERLAVAIVISSIVVWLLDLVRVWPVVYTLGAYPDGYMLQQRPWGIATYMWVHSDLMHLLINTLTLLVVGRLFERHYGDWSLLRLFVLGALIGALIYLVGYQILRGLDIAIAPLPLLGSSAGVYALALGAASADPHRRVQFLILEEVRLIYLIMVYLFIDWLLIEGNLGGRLAHFGGALCGILWGLRYRADKGGTMSWIHRLGCLALRRRNKDLKESIQDVNKILDKLRHSGLSGISDEERKALHRASGQLQHKPQSVERKDD